MRIPLFVLLFPCNDQLTKTAFSSKNKDEEAGIISGPVFLVKEFLCYRRENKNEAFVASHTSTADSL